MKIKLSILGNLKTLIVFSFFVLLTGCFTLKPGSVKSSKNLIETFYVGEDGTQYHIKPLTFTDSQNKEKIHLDFTFRYKNEVKDSVIINFSLLSSTIFKSIDSFSLSNTTTKTISKDIRLMFNEKRKDLFVSRFSTKISLVDFNKMFENTDWTIIVTNKDICNTYVSEKSTRKKITKLKEEIFVFF